MYKKVLISTALLISFASTASADTLYEVKKGDTLTKIANTNKIAINDLRSWNKLVNDSIYIKQKLVVKKTDVPTKVPSKVDGTQQVIDTTIPKQEAIVGELLTVAPLAEQAEKLSAEGQATYSLLIDLAKRLEGVPYLYAGNTIDGFDCSGFIYFLHAQTGLNITRQSSESYFSQTATVALPVAGDLVFFENTYKQGISHMGIYLGENKFVHAGSKGVEVASLDSSYWKEHFVSFNRFNLLTVK